MCNKGSFDQGAFLHFNRCKAKIFFSFTNL